MFAYHRYFPLEERNVGLYKSLSLASQRESCREPWSVYAHKDFGVSLVTEQFGHVRVPRRNSQITLGGNRAARFFCTFGRNLLFVLPYALVAFSGGWVFHVDVAWRSRNARSLLTALPVW